MDATEIRKDVSGLVNRMARAERSLVTHVDRTDVVRLCAAAEGALDQGDRGTARRLVWRAELLSQEVGR